MYLLSVVRKWDSVIGHFAICCYPPQHCKCCDVFWALMLSQLWLLWHVNDIFETNPFEKGGKLSSQSFSIIFISIWTQCRASFHSVDHFLSAETASISLLNIHTLFSIVNRQQHSSYCSLNYFPDLYDENKSWALKIPSMQQKLMRDMFIFVNLNKQPLEKKIKNNYFCRPFLERDYCERRYSTTRVDFINPFTLYAKL